MALLTSLGNDAKVILHSGTSQVSPPCPVLFHEAGIAPVLAGYISTGRTLQTSSGQYSLQHPVMRWKCAHEATHWAVYSYAWLTMHCCTDICNQQKMENVLWSVASDHAPCGHHEIHDCPASYEHTVHAHVASHADSIQFLQEQPAGSG